LESFVQTVLVEINLGALQIRQTFLINHDLDTLVLEDLVVDIKTRSDTDRVRPTGTTRCAALSVN
jgi:hypothetical protein